MPRESREESITSAEADGAREVGGRVAAAHARRSLAGALARYAMNMIMTSALAKLAVLGDSDAQFRLGYRFAHGRRHPKRWQQAARWWIRAAHQGHPRAQFK